MKRYYILLLPVLIALAGLTVLFYLPARGFQPAQAVMDTPDTGIVVNTLVDELNSDGDCSLREAVTAANTNAPVDACQAGEVLTDTITFGVAGTITVTSQLSVTPGGPLVIDGGEVITTSGGEITRVWWVETGSDLILQNLSVIRGYSLEGGGLYNNGIITIINSTFSGNRILNSRGGGIFNMGILTITDSTFSSNKVSESSGTSLRAGGGVYNSGTLTITNSTFSDNIVSGGRGTSIKAGGGVYNSGTLTITNSTFTNNRVFLLCGESTCFGSAYGGGVDNRGILSIVNSTFTGNMLSGHPRYGGGIHNVGSAVLTNTIVANSFNGVDCSGTISDGGHNLDSDGSCGLDPANDSLPDTDPLLGPLQDNGGSTWTEALLAGSPAIDAGDNAQCPPTDQRGVSRPQDGNWDGEAVCDMGAYEFPQGISLIPSVQSGSGEPGVSINYTFQLYNWTPLTDTYNLALSPHVWEITFSTDTLGPLPPGSSQAYTLTVTIPLVVAWYQTDTVVITATSVTSPTVYTASAQITTQANTGFYLPIILKEQQAGSPVSGAKPGTLGLLAVVFSGGLGTVLWLRRKIDMP